MGNRDWYDIKNSPLPKEAFRGHTWYPFLEQFIKQGSCELPNQDYAVVMGVLERLGYDSKALAGRAKETTILEGNHSRVSWWPDNETYATLSVPERTLLDLGGPEFTIMTGSSNYIKDGNTLRMNLARNKSGANRLYITLRNDLYDMRFFYYRSKRTAVDVEKGVIRHIAETIREVELFEGVFNSMLRQLFEEVTGFDTHLPIVKKRG